MRRYKHEKAYFYIYVHPSLNLLPEVVDRVLAPASTDDEELLEQWKSQQHPIMHKNLDRYQITRNPIDY